MPYLLVKTDKGFGVYNYAKKKYNSFNTTKKKAEAQFRLLNYLEHKKN